MVSVRQFIGAVLIILAVLKIIGLAFVFADGESQRTTYWICKQVAYVVSFAIAGYTMTRTES